MITNKDKKRVSNVDKHYTRMTNQRLVILEYLQETKDHPTAEKVYQKIKKHLPKISKATIYRNLNVLLKQKAISRLDLGERESRWEGHTDAHHHFLCTKCGRVIEVNLADIWQIQERLEGKYRIKVDDYQIVSKGLCDFCLKH